jgi:hypothetical protein
MIVGAFKDACANPKHIMVELSGAFITLAFAH